MNSTTLCARTVSIVKPFAVEQVNGVNGAFEKKSIMFRIAVDRDYSSTVVENGQVQKKHPTDFWLAKCTGKVAERFNQYCAAKDANGKLISRFLLLGGNFEQYNKPRKVEIEDNVNCGGTIYRVKLEKEVKDTPTIFIVNDIKFLDSPKDNEAQTVGTTSVATVVGVVSAEEAGENVQVAQPVASAPAQEVSQVPEAPTSQPVTPAVQTPQAQSTTVVQPEGNMQIPNDAAMETAPW